MITITDKAEERLAQLLGDDAKPSPHKCLHIQARTLKDDDFSQLPAFLEKWVSDAESKLMLCEDRDVFYLSNNLSLPAFTKFREIYRRHLGYSPEMAYFDSSITGAALRALVQAKLNKLKEDQKSEDERRRRHILSAALNPEMVATLPVRRASHKRTEILVIEDDPFSKKLMQAALSTEFSVTYAETGRKGILQHLAHAPNVVFLDINLPDVSGHDVLAKILSIDPDARIVMLSGNGNLENIRQAVDKGARGFIAKPFTKAKLLQYIDNSLKSVDARAGG